MLRLFSALADGPDAMPHKHVAAQTDLNAINPKRAYRANQSASIDGSAFDKIDDFELNEILWRAIKGLTRRRRWWSDGPLPTGQQRLIGRVCCPLALPSPCPCCRAMP